jgi:hypothetical protein
LFYYISFVSLSFLISFFSVLQGKSKGNKIKGKRTIREIKNVILEIKKRAKTKKKDKKKKERRLYVLLRASPAEALSYFSGFTLKLEHFAPKICYYIRPP